MDTREMKMDMENETYDLINLSILILSETILNIIGYKVFIVELNFNFNTSHHWIFLFLFSNNLYKTKSNGSTGLNFILMDSKRTG